MGLSKEDIALLRKFVRYTCEECKKAEGEERKDSSKVETLEPHRMRQGADGGKYILRNIKMLCPRCHDLFWYA